VAIFGRKTARQRLRRATQESLAIPAFSSPVDCTPWVIGGLWPAELSTVNAETATVAEYLKADLQRIVTSANEELKRIRQARMADPARYAEETRVINTARAFAARRVESTVRHLRSANQDHRVQHPRRGGGRRGHMAGTAPRFKVAASAPPAVEPPADFLPETARQGVADDRSESPPIDEDQVSAEPISTGKHAAPEPESDDTSSDTLTLPSSVDAVDTDVTEAFEAQPQQPQPLETEGGEAQAVAPEPAEATAGVEPDPASSTQLATTEPVNDAVADEPDASRAVAVRRDDAAHDTDAFETQPADDTDIFERAAPAEEAVESHQQRQTDGETEPERLHRLLQFVARQEPGLRWAVGLRADGTTVVVTDLAHGWIPSGITLPAGVRLLEPQRRTGNAATMLGPSTLSATYSPGDPLGWATDFALTDSSLQPRELPEVEDLGWLLSEATHWRDGLPRMVHTLAKAGAAGTGVVDAELDVLRVHLDTARYQLLAQYPDVDAALLLNCLLLAATEGIATGDRTSANYHFAWFQVLSAPPASRFSTKR
jgi:hypothetical protein